ncbi:MAG: winged helix-turn-helix transcriptional regulator [Candidatus Micrarchaeia archaeon]
MEFDNRYKLILRMLSEDSRASITELAKGAGTSRVTVAKLLEKLSNDYNIRYTIEVDDDRLGMVQRHLVVLRFSNKPKLAELSEALAGDALVSNAYVCDGDFDALVQVRASSPMDYVMWESQLPTKLGRFGITIKPSSIMFPNYGYFPIGAKELESVVTGISARERAMLAVLSSNSRARLSELAEGTHTSKSTANYKLFSLKKKGVIKRFTIGAAKPPYKYILAFLVNYHFTNTTYVRSVQMMDYYKHYDSGMPLFNTFQLLVPMSGSYRFFGMGLFRDEQDAMEHAIGAHLRVFSQEKPEIERARVTGIIKGSYPFRNLDIEANYTRFNWSKLDLAGAARKPR